MNNTIQSFFGETKKLYNEVAKAKSKTIASASFKQNACLIYENWKTQVEPELKALNLDNQTVSHLDLLLERLDVYAKNRVTSIADVKRLLEDVNKTFLDKIIFLANEKKPYYDLTKSASFLGLDENWFSATSALQLQEVSIKLVADKLNIDLNQPNVERILKAKFESKDFGFNQKYEAFANEIKRLHGIDVPYLTTQFRKIRVKVLHEGCNPETEDTDTLVDFTIRLLKKLEMICNQET